jgi:hypothetical protein
MKSSDTPAAGGHPVRQRAFRLVLRPLRDAAIAGVVFALATIGIVCPHARAGTTPAAFAGLRTAAHPHAQLAVAEPKPLPLIQISTAHPREAVYRRTSSQAAWGLLGVAFSLLAALNLAFLRHIKRAYAPATRRYPRQT